MTSYRTIMKQYFSIVLLVVSSTALILSRPQEGQSYVGSLLSVVLPLEVSAFSSLSSSSSSSSSLSLSLSSSSSSIHHCHHYRRRHNTFNCLRPSSTLLAIGGNSNSNGNGNVNGSYNPIEDETPKERASRMELVRKLQKSFYQDEKRPTYDLNDNSSNRNTNSNSATTTSATTDDGGNSNGGGTVIKNLPLWRVQWTELPGSQNILNVHVPHYTNMFQKILQGNIRSWDDDDDADDNDDDDDNDNENVYYFGHVFLPGGSENLDNPDYELRKGDVGVLMKISDCRQHKIDGRLTVIVQALERFTIVNPIRSHSPYAIADVEIDPDQEQIQMVTTTPTTVGAAAAAATTVQTAVRNEEEGEEGDDGDSIDNNNNKQNDDKEDNTTSMTKTEVQYEKERVAKAKAVAEAFSCHPFEYRSILIEDCYKQQQQQVGISPLSNYDETKLTKLEVVVNHNNNNDNDNNNRTNTSVNMNVNVDNRVLVAESNTWMKLDEMLQLLRIASGGMMVPVPTQILGLLPHSRHILRQRVVVPNNDTDIDTDTNHTNHNDDSHTSSTSDDDEQQQPMLSTMSDQVSWSSDFYLEKAALHMEGKFDRAADDDTNTSSSTSSSSTSSSTVGTYSKSPFVRVDSVFNDDDDDNNDTTSKCSSSSSSKSDNQVYYYSPLRRAQRFSYVIWTIMESISLSRSSSSSSSDATDTDTDTDTDRYSRQTVLELQSTTERLERATEKMEKICLLLKSMLYK